MPSGDYNTQSIKTLYDNLIAKGEQSKVDTLHVRCMVEVVYVNDLNDKLRVANNSSASDLVMVF